MSDIPKLDHGLLPESLALFARFATDTGRSDAIERVRLLEERYRSGLYRLVVVGEENRGKSSLISALLGEPALLPAGPEPMTAAVFKIVYGERLQHRVFFLPSDPEDPEGSRPEPLDVTPEEVLLYGTETGNPNNKQRVDFIAVHCPHPLLQAGLTIVDLPGLGGLKRQHGLLTLSYLPNADAAFFVTDSVSGALTREEMATLDTLRGFTNHLLFVQTKSDAVSTEQVRSYRDRNLEEIEKRLGLGRDAISYFTVSSKLKLDYHRGGDEDDLADSGFAPLLQTLEDDLIPRKHDRLAMPILLALVDEVADAAQSIENQVAILTTESEADLARIEDELRRGQRAFESWRTETWPSMLSQFHHAYGNALRTAQNRIETELDPGPYGPIVGVMMRKIEEAGWSANDIAEQSSSVNDAVVAMCGECLEEISGEFEQATLHAYDRAATQIGNAVESVVIERPGSGARPVTIGHRIRGQSGLWQTAMQGRTGLVVGTMAGSMIAGILFPPLGIVAVAATVLGGLFGASRSILDARKREREQAEVQLRGLLSDTVRQMQRIGMRELAGTAEKNRGAMAEALQQAVRQCELEERAAFDALKQRRQRTREEAHSQTRVLAGFLQQARDILSSLRRAGLPVPEEAPMSAAA